MGIFSGVKKAVKKVFKGIKKVFQKVLKPFAKILNNKIVKGLLIAASVFTAGATLMAAMSATGAAGGGFMAMLKTGVGEVVKMGVNTLKAPIDLVAKGISGIGNVTGAQSLVDFGQGLSSGLDSVVSSVDNIFKSPASTMNEGPSVLSENLKENLSGDTATNSAAGAAEGAEGATGLADTAVKSEGMLAKGESVAGTMADTGVINDPVSMSSTTINPLDAGAAPVAAESGISKAVNATGDFFSTAMDKVKGTASWMQDNPELTKIGGEMLMGAFEPSPEDIAKAEQEEYWKQRSKYGFKGGDAGLNRRPGFGLLRQSADAHAEQVRDNMGGYAY